MVFLLLIAVMSGSGRQPYLSSSRPLSLVVLENMIRTTTSFDLRAHGASALLEIKRSKVLS